MASFELKNELKEHLYYKAYEYKCVLRTLGARYVPKVSTIDEYKLWVGSKIKQKSFSSGIDYDAIEFLVNFYQEFNKTDGSTRKEADTITFYSNDITLLETLKNIPDTNVRLKWFKAELMPIGVRYMRTDPKYKFRIYLKDAKITNDLKLQFINHVKNVKDFHISSSLQRWTSWQFNYNNVAWCRQSFYIDYDDEKNLLVLLLKFPELMGKNYRLEKKP